MEFDELLVERAVTLADTPPSPLQTIVPDLLLDLEQCRELPAVCAIQCTLVGAVALGGTEDLRHQKWAVPIIRPSLTHSRTGQGAQQQHHCIHHVQQEGRGKKGAE